MRAVLLQEKSLHPLGFLLKWKVEAIENPQVAIFSGLDGGTKFSPNYSRDTVQFNSK